MVTARNAKIRRLWEICQSEVEAPLERIKAAERLLIDFGPSEDSVPRIREVTAAFYNNADPKISERAQKLKIKLAKALDLRREAAKADIGPPVQESIVAGTSASQIPKPLTLTWHGLKQIQDEQLGVRHFDKEFSLETQHGLLEAVLESKITIGGIQSLLSDLYKKDSNGWSLKMSFPLIAGFAETYLRQHGVEPVPEDNTEARRFLDELDAELAK